MMRVFLALFCAAAVTAFTPISTTTTKTTTTTTQLAAVNRRDLLVGVASLVLLPPSIALAESHAAQNRAGSHTNGSTFFFDDQIENVYEESQQPTGDKLDINGAIVTDYQQFRGMYPSAAGKIASNGPYKSVKDIYKISGLSDHDKAMFKKYEKELTVLPPGRMFDERINQRQST